MLRKFIFLQLGFLFLKALSASPIQAQTPPILLDQPGFAQDLESALKAVYNLEFDRSRDLLRKWKNQYPSHPLWIFWDGYDVWWDIFTDLEDDSKDQKFNFLLQKADYEAGRLMRDAPDHFDAVLVKTLANAFLARHAANRGEWINSMSFAKTAWENLDKLEALRPEHPDLLFSHGLTNYYAAVLPEQFRVVKTVSWMLPDGNKELGLAQLDSATVSGQFLRYEALYFAGNVRIQYENGEGASPYFVKLKNLFPDNPFYIRLVARSLSKQKKDRQVIDIAEAFEKNSVSTSDRAKPTWEELGMLAGLAWIRLKDPEKALPWLEKANQIGLQLPDGKRRKYSADLAYLFGKANLDLSNREIAKRWFKESLKRDKNHQNNGWVRSWLKVN